MAIPSILTGVGAVAVVAGLYVYHKNVGKRMVKSIKESNEDSQTKRRRLRKYLESCAEHPFNFGIYHRACPVCRKWYYAKESTHVGYGEHDKIKYVDNGCPVCHTKLLRGRIGERYHLEQTEPCENERYNELFDELSSLVEEIRPRVASYVKLLIDECDDSDMPFAEDDLDVTKE